MIELEEEKTEETENNEDKPKPITLSKIRDIINNIRSIGKNKGHDDK